MKSQNFRFEDEGDPVQEDEGGEERPSTPPQPDPEAEVGEVDVREVVLPPVRPPRWRDLVPPRSQRLADVVPSPRPLDEGDDLFSEELVQLVSNILYFFLFSLISSSNLF